MKNKITVFFIVLPLLMNSAHAATILVNDYADGMTLNGQCNLRKAIQAANTNTNVDGCVRVGSGTDDVLDYRPLTSAGGASIVCDSTLEIIENLTILGRDPFPASPPPPDKAGVLGSIVVNIDCASSTSPAGGQRLFTVRNGATLSLVRVNLTSSTISNAGGVLVDNGGTLNLTNSQITNTTQVRGAAILNHGMTTLTHSLIRDNTTFVSGSGQAQGGGIFSDGVLQINQSIVQHNIARSTGGESLGAGIYWAGNDSRNRIFESLVSENLAGDLTSPGAGGGIYSVGNLQILRSTLYRNDAQNNDTAGSEGGGAIYVGSGSVLLKNSTVENNSAKSRGGALYAKNTATVSILNTTINNNRIGRSLLQGAGLAREDGGSGPFTVKNTILSANSTDVGISNFVGSGITSQGHNLVSNTGTDTAGSFAVSLGDYLPSAEADLGLGVYGDHGGPTPTTPIVRNPASPLSLLIDHGDPVVCASDADPVTGLLTDQRRLSRAGQCDIGAYEFSDDIPGPAVTLTDAVTLAAVPSNTFSFGSVTVGSHSPTYNFVLENTGDAGSEGALTISSITSLSGMFHNERSTCYDAPFPQQYLRSQTCTFSISFYPTSAGAQSLDIVINHNQTQTRTTSTTFHLTGTAISDGASGAGGSSGVSGGSGGASGGASGSTPGTGGDTGTLGGGAVGGITPTPGSGAGADAGGCSCHVVKEY